MERKVVVQTLPVEEIIIDLSRQWKVPVEEESGELTIFLPKGIGEGYVRGSSFSSGVGVIQYKCTFYENYEIHFTKLDIHPLKFIFCSEGFVQHSFQDGQKLQVIETYQNVIVSSKEKKGHVLFFKANQKCHVTSVEIIRNLFDKRNNYQFKNLDPVMKTLFQDLESKKEFVYQGNYSLKAANVVADMEDQRHESFVRSVFLEGKILEMLFLQILQFQDDQRKDAPQIMRRSDLEIVEKAANLINENISENYTVDELAKKVGTNVNKLQEGFQFLHDRTVSKYIQHQKLRTARILLRSNKFHISEITDKIGFSNKSYFSKVFKDKYGVSPRYFQGRKK